MENKIDYSSYYYVEIPFISKKILFESNSKKNHKYGFSGTAYYIFNKNDCLKQQVFKLNKNFDFRPNDKAMMYGGEDQKGTKFWKTNKEERIKIFPISKENKIVYNSLQKKEFENLNNKINKLTFTKLNTIISLEGFLSGSNTSGAESRLGATPFYINLNSEYNSLRFTNFFNRLLCNKRLKERIITKYSDLGYIKKISLSELLLKKDFKDIFYKYNIDIVEPDKFNVLDIWNEDISEKSNVEKIKPIITSSEEILIRNYAISISSGNLNNSEIEKLEKDLVIKLKKNQKDKLIFELKQNNQNSHLIGNNLSIKSQYISYISPIKDSKNKINNFRKIADANNGIIIDKDTHLLFDKQTITFNANTGKISYLSNIKCDEKNINPIFLSRERKKYLSVRNEMLNKKRNI